MVFNVSNARARYGSQFKNQNIYKSKATSKEIFHCTHSSFVSEFTFACISERYFLRYRTS